MQTDELGFSQHAAYDDVVDAEIGERVRARISEFAPSPIHRNLALAIGMTPDAFSRSLNGKRAFTAVELVELAEHLKTSAHWFVTGEQDPFAIKFAGRHVFDESTMTHVPIDWSGEGRPLDDIALAYIQVFGQSEVIVPAQTALTASAVRAELTSTTGDDFVRTLAEAVEATFGIDVVRIRGVDRGFAMEVLGRQVIVVGETGNWFYENWSIAHELDHVLRGDLSERGDAACDDPKAEKRANAFAADLLLPLDLLRTVDWQNASEADVARFVWMAGVSTDALSRRLAVKRVNVSAATHQALDMKTQALLRAWWSSEQPGDPIAERMQTASARRFPGHLLSAHRLAVEDGLVPPATLAWMLGVEEASLAAELTPAATPPDVDWLARELGLLESDQ